MKEAALKAAYVKMAANALTLLEAIEATPGYDVALWQNAATAHKALLDCVQYFP